MKCSVIFSTGTGARDRVEGGGGQVLPWRLEKERSKPFWVEEVRPMQQGVMVINEPKIVLVGRHR
jgi:hypothetical protein